MIRTRILPKIIRFAFGSVDFHLSVQKRLKSLLNRKFIKNAIFHRFRNHWHWVRLKWKSKVCSICYPLIGFTKKTFKLDKCQNLRNAPTIDQYFHFASSLSPNTPILLKSSKELFRAVTNIYRSCFKCFRVVQNFFEDIQFIPAIHNLFKGKKNCVSFECCSVVKTTKYTFLRQKKRKAHFTFGKL